jgi:hypothetical protein
MRTGAAALGFAVLTCVSGMLPAQAPAKVGGGISGAMTNADVVKLCHSGLGEEVIIAKIKQAPQVRFDLETDDLVKLKQEKVSDAIVSAMLSRGSQTSVETTAATGNGFVGPGIGFVAPGVVVSGAGTRLELRLSTRDGDYELKPLAGSLSSTYAYVKMLHFMNYPGLAAKLRVHDRRPSVLVATDTDPRNRYFVVKTEVNGKDGDRSVKIGSGGLFRSKGLNQPDEDWTLEYQANEEKPGVWRLVLRNDLEAGEYGVYCNGNLYEFGLDR